MKNHGVGGKTFPWILFLLKAYPMKTQAPSSGPPGLFGPDSADLPASSVFPLAHLLTRSMPSFLPVLGAVRAIGRGQRTMPQSRAAWGNAVPGLSGPEEERELAHIRHRAGAAS